MCLCNSLQATDGSWSRSRTHGESLQTKEQRDRSVSDDRTFRLLQMSLVFNVSGLKDVRIPCIAQSFINHNARLYKLYVIREKYYVVERPSLKNFQPSG